MNRLALAVIAFSLSAAAFGQAYKWRDADGRVRYGDVPPPGVNATALRPPPPGAAAPASKGPASAAEKEADFRKRQLEAQKAREKQDLAAKDSVEKRENCARAQENVRLIESGRRIARTDAKGERYYIDDEQRAQELANARRTAQSWCD
jgi:hypothetical protein